MAFSKTRACLLIPILFAWLPFSEQQQKQESSLQRLNTLKSAAASKDALALPCGAYKQLEVNDSLIIESPNYSQNRNYPNALSCRWRFLFPRCAMTISCPNFRLSDFLCSDYMEVKDVDGKVTRHCGNSGPSNLTLARRAEVSFRTSIFFTSVGFRCQVVCIDDGSGNTNEFQPEPVQKAPPVDCACGQAVLATKIINGQETRIGEFPWMASLARTGSKFPFCGASIINSRYIMTAAHCASGRTPFNTEVIINEHNIQIESETATPTIRRKVDFILQHRSYTSRLDNDIALIRLREPLDFSGSIVPVCLPGNVTDTFADREGTVIGWGLTKENGGYTNWTRIFVMESFYTGQMLSDVLLKTDVDIISNEMCLKAYPNAVTRRMLCGYRAETDACQGDSGGPLLVSAESEYVGSWGYSETWNEQDETVKDAGFFKHTQVGIVSWGEGCARKDKPGVYSRVTEFMPWILRVTADGSFCTS